MYNVVFSLQDKANCPVFNADALVQLLLLRLDNHPSR